MNVPIAFFVFNRPDHTSRVLARIREARPRQLFVVADGPRAGRADDADSCVSVRAVIQKGIDWPCDVKWDIAGANLGCGRRVSSGLDWVFSCAPEAIILEDDCLPDPVFFRYCAELLERYRDEPAVGAIGGSNFQSCDVTQGAGYYFSRYPHCWGWATWQRAWRAYDYAIGDWAEKKQSRWLRTKFDSSREVKYWEKIFDRVASGEINTWDYQWAFACWRNDFLTALPTASLVSNIGFGSDATHTREASSNSIFSTRVQPWPLQHPLEIVGNAKADRYTFTHHFSPPPWIRAWRKLIR